MKKKAIIAIHPSILLSASMAKVPAASGMVANQEW